MIELSKGGRINLSKDESGNSLDTIFFGTNWGAIKKRGFFGSSSDNVDLDESVILLDKDGKYLKKIYFGNRQTSGIYHSPDDVTGDVDGDDGIDNEYISVTLSKVESNVEHIFFVLNSYRDQKFSDIPYIGIRIYTTPDNQPKMKISSQVNILAKYDLKSNAEDFKDKYSVILGEAYRRNGEWKFKAIGEFGQFGGNSNAEDIDRMAKRCVELI